MNLEVDNDLQRPTRMTMNLNLMMMTDVDDRGRWSTLTTERQVTMMIADDDHD